MRIATVVLIGLTMAASAQMPPRSPLMSAQQVKRVLDEKRIDPITDNLPTQIMNGDAEALKAMMALGVDMKAKTSPPQSPLELAAMSCSNPCVEPGVSVR